MSEKHGYIRAKIKTQGQIAHVYPSAVYWAKPIDDVHWCRGADEAVLPYVGKIIWVKKIRQGLYEFYYEIKATDGFIVMPNWISYFDSEHLVPPAKWNDSYEPSIVDDVWLNSEVERIIFIEDLLIITG